MAALPLNKLLGEGRRSINQLPGPQAARVAVPEWLDEWLVAVEDQAGVSGDAPAIRFAPAPEIDERWGNRLASFNHFPTYNSNDADQPSTG